MALTMLTPRVRSYNRVASITGSRQNPIDFGFQTRKSGEECETTDIVGNRFGNNSFHLIRKIHGTTTLSGQWPTSGTPTWFMYGYPVDWSLGPPDPRTWLPEPSSLDLASWHTILAARTNPSRPHINMPAFTGELVDSIPGKGVGVIRALPRALYEWSKDNIVGRAARSKIIASFVIQPMISDFMKMLDFQSSVDKRIKELEKIRDKGSSSSKATFETISETVDMGNLIVHSTYEIIYAHRTVSYSRRAWGTARWHPLTNFGIPRGDAELRNKTRRVLQGFSLNGASAAAWELLPWSWLIDYFAGVGDFIQAKQNAFELEMRGTCIMVQDTAVENFSLLPGSWNSWLTASQPNWSTSWIEKRRYPISDFAPFIPPRKPMLSFRQLSILSSLAVLKSGAGQWKRS